MTTAVSPTSARTGRSRGQIIVGSSVTVYDNKLLTRAHVRPQPPPTQTISPTLQWSVDLWLVSCVSKSMRWVSFDMSVNRWLPVVSAISARTDCSRGQVAVGSSVTERDELKRTSRPQRTVIVGDRVIVRSVCQTFGSYQRTIALPTTLHAEQLHLVRVTSHTSSLPPGLTTTSVHNPWH